MPALTCLISPLSAYNLHSRMPKSRLHLNLKLFRTNIKCVEVREISSIGKMRIISEQLTYDKSMREISSTPIFYFICIAILEIFYWDIQAQFMSPSARIQTGTMHRNWLLMPFLEHSNGCPNIASLLCTMAIFLRKLVSIFDWLNGHLSWRCWPIQKQFYLSHTVAWKGDFISLESSEYQLGAHPCI